MDRVDIERDGRSMTLEWSDEMDHLALSIRAGDRIRRTTYAWSHELTTFVANDGGDLLVAFRDAVMELALPKA